MEWVVNATTRPLYPREKDAVPIIPQAGWTTGTDWTGEENLASTGIRSQGRTARSDSLCQLRHAGPHNEWLSTYGLMEAGFSSCLTALSCIRVET